MSLNKDKIRQETIAKMDALFEKKVKGEHREAMIKAINQGIDELAILTEKRSTKSSKSLRSSLSHLPQKRIDLIRHSFDIQTFHPSVDKERKTCDFLKDGLSVKPTVSIDTAEGLLKANNNIQASIVVECVVFALNLLGVSPPEKAVLAAVEFVYERLADLHDILQLFEDMKKAVSNDDMLTLAKLVIEVITTLFDNLLIDIVRVLLSNMSWFDWVIFCAKLTAFVAALIATAGLAEVAEIIVLVTDAAGFLRKFIDI